MGRSSKKRKGDSQLFTYSELVKNNEGIFSKEYPRSNDEPINHYICKVFCGEQLRKYYESKLDELVIQYEEKLPPMYVSDTEFRTYQPDIYIEYINHDEQVIHLADCEINGPIHFKNKKQYLKNKIRREAIVSYFGDRYQDARFPEYQVIFSYVVFTPEEFLYNKFDYFRDIFEDKFFNGGIHQPAETIMYEKLILR